MSNTSQIVDYDMKKFEKSEWIFDGIKNEVCRVLTLRVSETDCRHDTTKPINELGLYIANPTTGQNPELFSRITFDSESLKNPAKQLQISYYIYA